MIYQVKDNKKIPLGSQSKDEGPVETNITIKLNKTNYTHPITLYPLKNDIYAITIDNAFLFPKLTNNIVQFILADFDIISFSVSGVVVNVLTGGELVVGQTSSSTDSQSAYFRVDETGENNGLFFSGIARRRK